MVERMDGRMKKYGQLSPERAKVWTEKSPNYRYSHPYNSSPPAAAAPPPPQLHRTGKVPVIYYLCRNRQLDHPHFMEVPLTSDDLYLRDVIERLNVLRGRGIGSMYSWSCKRSYKNGYVWHDLCDDDVILPAHGSEYILKGSEIFEESNPGRFSPAPTFLIQSQRALPGPPSPQNQEGSSPSSSLNGRTMKSSQDDELSPRLQPPRASMASPESNVEKVSSWNGPLSLTEYKSECIAHDASTTQTEIKDSVVVEKGVSTDDVLLQPPQNQDSEVKEIAEEASNADTLESLIRADVKKLKSFRIIEEEGFQIPSSAKIKIINMLMQLISCGYVQEKGHNFGLIQTYNRPRFSSSKLQTTSLTLGEMDHLSENPRSRGVKVADKKCFSGSLAEKRVLEDFAPTLKRSSSYNADRSTKHFDCIDEHEEETSTISKCVPISIKASLTKQLRCELLRSPISGKGESSRKTEPFSGENVIKIEESLPRELELIQSKASS